MLSILPGSCNFSQLSRRYLKLCRRALIKQVVSFEKQIVRIILSLQLNQPFPIRAKHFLRRRRIIYYTSVKPFKHQWKHYTRTNIIRICSCPFIPHSPSTFSYLAVQIASVTSYCCVGIGIIPFNHCTNVVVFTSIAVRCVFDWNFHDLFVWRDFENHETLTYAVSTLDKCNEAIMHELHESHIEGKLDGRTSAALSAIICDCVVVRSVHFS